MYLLICEGKCNPHIRDVDHMIHQFSLAKNRLASYDGTYHMIVAQRLLKHTPHWPTDDGQAVCDECGTERQWGWRRGYKRAEAVHG